MYPPLFCFAEELSPDQHATNFARSGADLVKLGVAQQAPGGVLVDITIAAKQLDGIERHLGAKALAVTDIAPVGVTGHGGAVTVLGARDARRALDKTAMFADLDSQEKMRQAIREEKRRELMFEGQRWLDLLRWNPQYAMDIVNTSDPGRLYLPIPENEITINNGVLAPNPGW